MLIGKLGYSPPARSALAAAAALAQELSHGAADERHILVATLGSGEPILTTVLGRVGIQVPSLCPELADVLENNRA